MSTDDELTKRAKEALEKEVADVKSISGGPILRGFLGGDLVVMEVEYLPDTSHPKIKTPEEPEEFFVLLQDNHTFVYEYPLDLLRQVLTYKPNLWHRIVAAVSVPGLIALAVTITICGLLVAGRTDVPQVLSAALTIILGYYFGKQSRG